MANVSQVNNEELMMEEPEELGSIPVEDSEELVEEGSEITDIAICIHPITINAILDFIRRAKGDRYVLTDRDVLTDTHEVLMFLPVSDLGVYIRVIAVVGNVADTEDTKGIYFGEDKYRPVVLSTVNPVHVDPELIDEIGENGLVQELIKESKYIRLDSHNMVDFDIQTCEYMEVDPEGDYDDDLDEARIEAGFDIEIIPVDHIGKTIELSFDKKFIEERIPKDSNYEVICAPVEFQVDVYQTLEVPSAWEDFYSEESQREADDENYEEFALPYVIDNNFASKAMEATIKKVYPWSLTDDVMAYEEGRINSLTEYNDLIRLADYYRKEINEITNMRDQVAQLVQFAEGIHASMKDLPADQMDAFTNMDLELEESRIFLDEFIENRAKLSHLMKMVDDRLINLFGDKVHSPQFIQEQLMKGLNEMHDIVVNSDNADAKTVKRYERRIDGANNRFSTEYLENKITENGKKLKKEINRMFKKAKTNKDKLDALYFACMSYTSVLPQESYEDAISFLDAGETQVSEEQKLADWLLMWYLMSKTAAAKDSGNDAYYKMHLYNITEMDKEFFDIDVDVEEYRSNIQNVANMLYNLIIE